MISLRHPVLDRRSVLLALSTLAAALTVPLPAYAQGPRGADASMSSDTPAASDTAARGSHPAPFAGEQPAASGAPGSTVPPELRASPSQPGADPSPSRPEGEPDGQSAPGPAQPQARAPSESPATKPVSSTPTAKPVSPLPEEAVKDLHRILSRSRVTADGSLQGDSLNKVLGVQGGRRPRGDRGGSRPRGGGSASLLGEPRRRAVLLGSGQRERSDRPARARAARGALPRTGASVWLLGLVGIGCLLGGLLLRRVAGASPLPRLARQAQPASTPASNL